MPCLQGTGEQCLLVTYPAFRLRVSLDRAPPPPLCPVCVSPPILDPMLFRSTERPSDNCYFHTQPSPATASRARARGKKRTALFTQEERRHDFSSPRRISQSHFRKFIKEMRVLQGQQTPLCSFLLCLPGNTAVLLHGRLGWRTDTRRGGRQTVCMGGVQATGYQKMSCLELVGRVWHGIVLSCSCGGNT